MAARLAARPVITYDEALPVNARREEIAKAINDHQVVVICGETGSGKTTQLPKICLEMGRGCAGLIGHTQPRRIAARATATRIAQETAVDDMVHEIAQIVPEAVDVEQAEWLRVIAQCIPRPRLEQFVQRPDPARKRNKRIAQLGHLGLALVHRRDGE